MGELIAVVSGKGGTGKTTVCAGMASALAQAGESVLCIDCDTGLGNLDISLGISELNALSFADVLSGNYGLNQSLQHPAFETLRFLTAPMRIIWSADREQAFEKMLTKAKKKFSYVFLDVPTGLGDDFRRIAKLADQILLVTGFDPASIRNGVRVSDELEKMGKTDVRLIVNRVDEKLFSQMRLTVDDIMDETGVPLLGLVPEDGSVVMTAAGKMPLFKKNKKSAAAACGRIAKRLQGIREPIDI